MKMLRQLIQDAQTVLRDMSTTQRVAVTALIVTVAGWLAAAAFLGSVGNKAADEVPLPLRVAADESKDVQDVLTKAGFPNRYDIEKEAVIVPAARADDAYLLLVREKVANSGNIRRPDLDAMAEKMSFIESQSTIRVKSLNARANSVIRLVSKLDGIAEADVIYSDDRRASIFLGNAPLSASVFVKTKMGRPLDQAKAQTIISLVALAKGGLSEDNVVVTDQTAARQFRNLDRFTPGQMHASRLEMEAASDEVVRRKIEALINAAIPGLANEGVVSIVASHKYNNDRIERSSTKYDKGLATKTYAYAEKQRSLEGPPFEPGVRPNVGTSGVVDAENAGAGRGGARRESSRDIKKNEKDIQLDRYDEVNKPAPELVDVTLSVMIRMPYELERDADGKTVPDVNEYGEPILDPETRRPVFRKKSVPPLSPEEIRQLQQAFARAANIAPDKIADNIYVDVRPWRQPVYAPPGAEPWSVAFWKSVRANAFSIVAGILAVAFVLVIVQQARQNIHTTLEEEATEEEIGEELQAEVPEEDATQTEMEATRQRVRNAVLEDPKRAAMLVRRWMTKE